jgi:indole-3-glycerol phosphate synthase
MILDQILEQTRKTVAMARRLVPLTEVERQAAQAAPVRDFRAALRRPSTVACISEFKRRSPSKGWIRQAAQAEIIASAYQAAGASAISVLTDEPFFGGSLDDLRRVRATVSIPILRKDFVVDAYQVAEARAAGADAVLLIVAALSRDDLAGLLAEIRRWGMHALVETHDRQEVETALAVGAEIIGVNHRDLRTFHMNMDLAASLRPSIPADVVVVAESGIRTVDDVTRMRAAGIDAILVGESLMAEPDPGLALRKLLCQP